MREQELSIQSRTVKFDEWTAMGTSIRQLRNDLGNPPTNDEDERPRSTETWRISKGVSVNLMSNWEL